MFTLQKNKEKVNGNQINFKWRNDKPFSKKILRRLDYLAEVASCTLENEKKFMLSMPLISLVKYNQCVVAGLQ